MHRRIINYNWRILFSQVYLHYLICEICCFTYHTDSVWYIICWMQVCLFLCLVALSTDFKGLTRYRANFRIERIFRHRFHEICSSRSYTSHCYIRYVHILGFSVNVPPLAQDAKVEKDMKEDRLSDLSETDSEERWSLFSFDYCCRSLRGETFLFKQKSSSSKMACIEGLRATLSFCKFLQKLCELWFV